MLSYTDSELVWECKTVARCQCKDIDSTSTEGDEPYDSDSGFYVSKKSDASPPETWKLFFEKQIVNNVLSTEELVLVWMDVVFHYAPLQLANLNGRLPALSGLAR
jgi:hypothetical protein